MNALPSFDLTGQVALVTGAARGLGRAIALALAEAGADVALGLRELGCDAGLEAEIVARGRHTLSLQMDMSNVGQIHEAVAKTAQQFGRVDILVNNAGIALGDLAENV
jgi:NAD(P)-dependent dehydrogenase (short-subunit alcohol dehydrogenase family)